MINPKDIITGWVTYIQGNDETKNRIEERISICSQCEYMGHMLNCQVCKKCGCPLKAKSANKNSHCPLKKW